MISTRRTFLKLTSVGAAGLLTGVAGSRGAGNAAAQNDTAKQEFFVAVGAGDQDSVARLLTARPDLLRAADEAGRSAYALAHLCGHHQIGDYLIAQGYPSDAHEAALARDWDRFDTLIKDHGSVVNENHPIGGTTMYAAAVGGAGADLWRIYAAMGRPDVVPATATGAAPLQAALRYSDLATAEMTAATLLGNAADPNPGSDVEDSPLHIAAERGSVELVEMLVRLGADVTARSRRGLTPAQTATAAGHTTVTAMLARHGEIPRTHSTSRIAYDAMGRPYAPPDIADISAAVRSAFVGESHFNLEFVTEATSAEPRLVHSVATTSEICVEACAHTGRKRVVEFLLERGAPYSLPTAVVLEDRARVEQLLDEDPARINERGPHDFALLWYPVIGECSLDMIELLLARGAQVERQSYLGTTALHWACRRGRIDMVDLLIQHGADVNRRGRKFEAAGASPLETARAGQHEDVARLLIQRGARA